MAGFAAWTVALAIVTSGCSNADRNKGDAAAGSAGTSGATAAAAADANDPATMTVTGCLERGDESDFVLTHVSARPQPVAPRGGNAGERAEEKQPEGPARAYRLSGGPDELRDWVGRQVRVMGKLEDRGGVQSPDASRQMKEGEPAKLEVTSAESLAETCGDRR